ncbi:hypothetical protein Q5P01_012114 [Channa striata]|uniref:Uncharacterized protein n=1 Tax=Channa striata TaxID=64152 RepID=A0AA88SQR3_CHASR|nr:hypothetical protein Q5P01_012114 [Channa striata]
MTLPGVERRSSSSCSGLSGSIVRYRHLQREQNAHQRPTLLKAPTKKEEDIAKLGPSETRGDEHLNHFLGSTMLNFILN